MAGSLSATAQRVIPLDTIPGTIIPRDTVDQLIKRENKTIRKSAFTPFGNTGVLNRVSNIALSSALNDGQNAKIELNYNFDLNWTGGLSVDQKIGKDAEKATFYDFKEGLSAGTTLKFSVQKMLWNHQLSTSEFKRFDEVANQYAKDKGADRRTLTYNDIKDHGTDEQKESLKHVKLRLPLFINLQVAFTKTSFAYATDSVSLNKITADRITPTVIFWVGKVLSVNSYLTFNYTFARNYNQADESTFNVPFGTTKNTLSEKIIFGQPEVKSDHKFTVEFRKAFGDFKAPDFAIDPSVTYGVRSNKIAVAIPLYFIGGATENDKPTGLQAGISLGYVSKLDHIVPFKTGFGAQLIITTPFKVFGNL